MFSYATGVHKQKYFETRCSLRTLNGSFLHVIFFAVFFNRESFNSHSKEGLI